MGRVRCLFIHPTPSGYIAHGASRDDSQRSLPHGIKDGRVRPEIGYAEHVEHANGNVPVGSAEHMASNLSSPGFFLLDISIVIMFQSLEKMYDRVLVEPKHHVCFNTEVGF